jgi:hypothetical protein
MTRTFQPAVEFLAAHPYATPDLDGRDLAVGDQLVGTAAGTSQGLRHLRDLQVLVPVLVHVLLLRSGAIRRMLRHVAVVAYRKSKDLQIPDTREGFAGSS